MDFAPTLFCISLIMSITDAQDLKCYTCFYNEGHSDSDSNCLDNPSPDTLKNCSQPQIPGLAYARPLPINLTLNEVKLCHEYSATVNGKKMVIRGCDLEIGIETFNCTNAAFILFGDRNVTDIEACFCPLNKCNGRRPEQISHTEKLVPNSTHSDGTCHQLTSMLLLAFIIYYIHDCVTTSVLGTT